ncbi:hypothetical protein [Flavobacterium sp. RSP15]|uniref:hypothetical protein n=1 Tax=Flavobacterium sp. RSP15 TaxID=2497485 RepID=UPI000F84E1E7|nr:hypothetical protein [Flavobacterium sp. RSP15]RTY86335.1 hypothetical protein EKM00_10300 [Flavobacterium sp. RSP15]
MTEYTILKLKNINLEERLKQFPPNDKNLPIKDLNADFLYLLIHFVLEQMANRIDKDGHANLYDEFNRLSSTTLESYNKNYRFHIRYLCENFPNIGNIFERDNYSEGRCYGYRLRHFYHWEQLEPYVITDRLLVKKLNKNNVLVLQPEMQKKFEFLAEYFNPKRLTIQFQEALNHNSDILEEKGNMKNYLVNAFKILKIQNGTYYMSHNPETDGRFHSNITGFSKEFRPFLRFDGEIISEIDISASVPTFLFYLIGNHKNSNSHLDKVINKTKSFYSHYMFSKEAVSIDNKEIQYFGNSILSGEFYSSFIHKLEEFYNAEYTYTSYIPILDEFGKPHYTRNNSNYMNAYNQWQFEEYYFPQGSYKNYDRKPYPETVTKEYAKEKILSMLNAKNKTFLYEEMAFKSLYPTIFEFVAKIKEKNHKHFSHLMLQMESFFMLKIVARRLKNKFKKVPFFTLHDCICTTESNLNLVNEFMTITLTAELGFTPVIKMRHWI